MDVHSLRPVCALLCFTCWAGSPTLTFAQSEPQAPLPARAIESGAFLLLVESEDVQERRQDLTRWMDEFAAWKKWRDQWQNRIEPGFFHVRERRPRPDPPGWLFNRCADAPDADDTLGAACQALAEWSDDAAAQVRRQAAATQPAKETPPPNTQWWEHLHVDTLWILPQPGARVYGVIGVHATIEIAGRLQIFVAPGAILMNLPAPSGTREWKPATDWGFAIRLFDFRLPGTRRRATLHANVAKAWVLAGPTALGKTTLDLAGLSMTLKKR